MAETERGKYFIEEIAPGAVKIYEERNASMYLVCGTSRAVLIDTAYGLSNLKELAAEFTDLPVEVINTHGHTPGSIILLDRDEKICYAGDSIIENVWLFLEESLPIEVYLDSLKKVNKILKDAGIEKIYNGHFCYNPIAVRKMDDIIAGVESIVAGTASGVPFENHAGSGIEYPFDGFKVLYRK